MFLYFILLYCGEFHIKLANIEKYFSSYDGKYVILKIGISNADIFDLENTEHPDEYNIIVKNRDNKVWDIEDDVTNLIYSKNKTDTESQRFSIIELPQGKVSIKNSPYICMEYEIIQNRFKRNICDSTKILQQFEIVPLYKARRLEILKPNHKI